MGRSTYSTLDISGTGATATVEMAGATILSVHIRGDAAATYQVDVRDSREDWMQAAFSEYSGSADYDDVLETGVEEVRVRVSSTSGTGGDEADVYLSAGGG